MRDIVELNAQYEQSRLMEYRALLEREEKAYALDARFLRLKRERDDVRTTLAQEIQGGAPPRAASEAAKLRFAMLDERERTLLNAYGLPSDYLKLRVHCALCGDTGYVGDPLRRRCICFERALAEKERASSQLSDMETFESFDADIYPSEAQRRQMLAARKYLVSFAELFPNNAMQNLVLMGAAGLGKSFLLNAIGVRVQERGFEVKKITAYNMQQKILDGIRNNKDAESAFIDAPLLLIDDLGTEPMLNNITREYLFSILNERYNGKRHTVIATNLSQEKLQERYGERIFTRLLHIETGVLKLSGENLRLMRGIRG